MKYMRYVRVYFSVNRILFLMIGLWPYQRAKFIQIQSFLFLSIQTIYILSQLGVFFTTKCTTDVILKILLTTFFFAIGVVNYASFYVNAVVVKYLINQIQHNYDELKDENEIAIMDEYGNKGKRITTMLTVFLAFILSAIYLLQFWPCILDVIVPENNTRAIHILQLLSEYSIDREKYFYLILFHSNITISICGFTMVSTGSMFIACTQHTCGMFKVASYRIQHAINLNVSQSTKLQSENPTYKEIIRAIDVHRKSQKFAEILISSFAVWIALLIGFGVISTSLNLVRIFLTLSSKYDVEELTIHVLLLTGQYLYMFLANYNAQEVTDHNNHVFTTVYNIRWYMTPLQTQKVVLFMLQRGTKAYYLTIGGLFVGSLEGFATLMSASISYFTVIYSTRR